MLRRLELMLVAAVLALAGAAGPVRGQDQLTESPDGPEAVKVYFTPDEALARVFAEADSLWSEEWIPTPGQRSELETRLGWAVTGETFVVHRGIRDGQDQGYAMIMEEQGRFKPITFMVKVKADLRVEMVLVMVYRESRGDGVKRQRFLKQFRDKDESDHLRLNRDIVAVSGATMSSRALAIGVKKALAILTLKHAPRKDGP
ncbi:MAG: FMN-binding protein [Candidatus Krumholzibacteriota bacterium]